MSVDEMSVEELRVEIAERVYTRHDWQQTDVLANTVYCARCGMTAGKANPDVWGPYCDLDGQSPNWPNDIAAATDLLQDADRRGWYVVLDNDAGYEGDAGAPQVWNCYMHGEGSKENKTIAEAISRAWLRAVSNG